MYSWYLLFLKKTSPGADHISVGREGIKNIYQLVKIIENKDISKEVK